ncbi:hypothetical protein FACS189490_02150 [Clostridia bacterium]|nr:hypothetical protein FACS189490_02150 [Clostridia bacterium]
MSGIMAFFQRIFDKFWSGLGLGMRTKLIVILITVKIIPLLLLLVIAWRQFVHFGDVIRDTAVTDSHIALNHSAVDSIERMTTDTARAVADFLYERDADILYLSEIEPNEAAYKAFIEHKTGRVVEPGA